MKTTPEYPTLAISSELDEVLNSKTPAHFDILRKQTETPLIRGGEKAFLQAARENQPTDLPIPSDEGIVHFENVTVSSSPDKNRTEKVKNTEEKKEEKFLLPSQILLSLDEMIKSGRLLKFLRFSVADATSSDDVEYFLFIACEKGDITVEEKREMLAFLKSETTVSSISEKVKNPPNAEGDLKIEEVVGETLPEQIEDTLREARSEYATQLIAWKNEIRQKKGKFAKVLADLGGERSLPDQEKPQELKDAEEAYLVAKKKKRQVMFSQSETMVGMEGDYQFNMEMIKEAENEYISLQRKITESLPPLEKGIVTKAFEKWAKLPMPARVALSTALLTGTSVAIGSLALGGAAAYGGYRLARGLAGASVSQGVGKLVDGIFRKGNERMKSNILEQYGTNISEENFEKKEKEMMRAFEKEENAIKRQRLYKATAMITSGGFAAGVLGKISSLQSAVNAPTVGGGVRLSENIPKSGVIVSEPTPPPVPGPMLGPKVVAELPTTKVELSPRGFIQDFENLKAKLVEQYGGTDKVPGQYEHFVKTPAVKLAQEFGFYDAEKNMSGIGLKGESLILDTKGNLVYHQLDCSDHIMMDTNTGSVEEKFSGKMFTKDISEEATADNVSVETKPQSEVSVEPEVVENAPQATEAENVPEISEPVSESEMPAEPHGAVESTPMEAEASVSEPQILRHFPRSFEETSISTPSGVTLHYDISTGKSIPESLLLNEVEFARRYNSGGAEIWELDDKFQNGNEYKNVRALLAQSTEDPRYVKQLGRIVMSVPFEDGKIHIVQGVGGGNPNEATVLLNGKEVARGTLTQTGPKIELIKGLKGGLLFPDTAYERAFKKVLPVIKTLKMRE